MAGDQLILDLFGEQSEESETPVDDLFEPNGRRRCPAGKRPLACFGGRFYCLHAACSGGV